MNDNRPQNHDDGSQPGEPQGGWYGNGGADETQQFDRPGQYGQDQNGSGQYGQYGQDQYGQGHYAQGGAGQQYGQGSGQADGAHGHYGQAIPSSGQGWEASNGAGQYDSGQYDSGQYGAAQFGSDQPGSDSSAASPYGSPEKKGDAGSKTALIGGIALVAGLLLGGALGFAGGSSSSTEAAPTTVTETATETTTVESTVEVPAPPPEEPEGGEDPAPAGATITGDGTYLVGADIEPGTYRNSGTESCYWARLSGTSGDFDDIITNNFGSGQQVVTIAESDVAFETTRCGTWEKIS